MKESSFIKKPSATVIVLIIIAIVIFYLNSQKTDINKTAFNNQLTSNGNSVLKPNEENKNLNIETSQIDREKALKYPKAPDFVGIARWINSEPLTMAQLKGKVVLVDIWTYTCINCIRTLPYYS